MKDKKIALKILSIIGIVFIILGLYALSDNVTMKETIGIVTHCERVYDYHREKKYWRASAKFTVDGTEYMGAIYVNSRRVAGEKIKILYNKKDPDDFINKSSTYSGFVMIAIGLVFTIPKIKGKKKGN